LFHIIKYHRWFEHAAELRAGESVGHVRGGHQFKCQHLMRSRTEDHHATYRARNLGQRVCILTLLSRILIIIPLLARTEALVGARKEYTGSNKPPKWGRMFDSWRAMDAMCVCARRSVLGSAAWICSPKCLRLLVASRAGGSHKWNTNQSKWRPTIRSYTIEYQSRRNLACCMNNHSNHYKMPILWLLLSFWYLRPRAGLWIAATRKWKHHQRSLGCFHGEISPGTLCHFDCYSMSLNVFALAQMTFHKNAGEFVFWI